MTNPLTRFVISHGKRMEVETLPCKEPIRIRKRRDQFAKVPMWWAEKLFEAPMATGATWGVAVHLCHLHWKNRSKPFVLPNGMLKYDGISRYTKWRALNDLERRDLINVEKRHRKSPIIHLKRDF